MWLWQGGGLSSKRLEMNKIYKYMILLVSALAFVACAGTVDNEANGSVPEGVLRIFADKTVVTADGNEEVTFTVMFGSENVSNSKTMRIIREFDGDEKYMGYGVNKFSTVAAGTYTFTAMYYYSGTHHTDNSVKVTAEEFFSGDEKNYARRYLGTLFTSTGCNSCPLAANGLKKLQEEHPDEIILAAFHAHMPHTEDPMTISMTNDFRLALDGGNSLPAFFWNMREDSHTGGAAFTNSYIEEQGRSEVFSGVALSTSYDETLSKLDIEVRITSNKPSVFRYMLLLVEDGIPATGAYAQNGQNDSYVHYNVVRDALTGPSGNKLNEGLPLNVGIEVKASKSITVPAEWNVENMRVIAAAMTSDDGGSNWVVNNVNECKPGYDAPYIYVE